MTITGSNRFKSMSNTRQVTTDIETLLCTLAWSKQIKGHYNEKSLGLQIQDTLEYAELGKYYL